MATHDPDNTAATVPRRWRWVGVSGVVGVAVLLLVATVWLSQGGASPLAGATGAASPGATTAPGSSAPSATPTDPSAAPAPEASPPVATETPAPGPTEGSAAPLAELPAVPLTEQVAPVPGVVFGIDGLESVEGVAQGPGEVGGPALRFTLTVRNDTDATVSLMSTVVNLYAGSEQLPMIDLQQPGAVPLPDEVAAGGSVTGVFVFAVPVDERGQVKVGVDYTVGVPIVVFEGAAPE
ncbi:hypothetical protein BJQ94_16565 [Cryobacterium sp. SO2]|uniref:hypothetical protein n=1 Tax=Cryobacterium sp. SO2 TaxID=1897060 RepID=UPI00223D0BE7|nr:hypothetical protein [Cryobacterium sp. SO2]WEO76946.1 hypothetical protein BJQ94_16565 [Cryobacterium sp. SO2]